MILGRPVSPCVHVQAARFRLGRLPWRKNLRSGSPCRSSSRHWTWVRGVSERAHIHCSLWAHLPLYNTLRISADPEPSPGFRPINVSWHLETSKAPSEAGMRCQRRVQLLLVICFILLCATKIQGEASTPISSDQHREGIPIARSLQPAWNHL